METHPYNPQKNPTAKNAPKRKPCRELRIIQIFQKAAQVQDPREGLILCTYAYYKPRNMALHVVVFLSQQLFPK